MDRITKFNKLSDISIKLQEDWSDLDWLIINLSEIYNENFSHSKFRFDYTKVLNFGQVMRFYNESVKKISTPEKFIMFEPDYDKLLELSKHKCDKPVDLYEYIRKLEFLNAALHAQILKADGFMYNMSNLKNEEEFLKKKLTTVISYFSTVNLRLKKNCNAKNGHGCSLVLNDEQKETLISSENLSHLIMNSEIINYLNGVFNEIFLNNLIIAIDVLNIKIEDYKLKTEQDKIKTTFPQNKKTLYTDGRTK